MSNPRLPGQSPKNHYNVSRQDLEILLSHVARRPREFFLAHPDWRLTPSQVKKFTALARRRQKGEPLAYLIGHKEFFGLDFLVDRHVLIPRPETEMIVEEILAVVKDGGRAADQGVASCAPKILDVGTGSGCIAIALKKYLPPAEITATDISVAALKVARQNARQHRVKIKFIKSDLLGAFLEPIGRGLKKTGRSFGRVANFDIIAANLPYLDPREKHPSIKYEPRIALYAGRQGLKLYQKLFAQIAPPSKRVTVSNKKTSFFGQLLIFCEINSLSSRQAKALAKKYFPAATIIIKKDLAQRDRLMIIKIK